MLHPNTLTAKRIQKDEVWTDMLSGLQLAGGSSASNHFSTDPLAFVWFLGVLTNSLTSLTRPTGTGTVGTRQRVVQDLRSHR